ncbi:hypothetical protein [Enterocloster bolteae]|uniref:hypothetical protein n=1 Tax=Enterocloster bolteae TaxID=208479 RepID=UPI002109B6E1|nr:hypothetical protein [Enterocloster bolteae]MCQ5144330.1 hypothetical protein [Enterocloster bolteae]
MRRIYRTLAVLSLTVSLATIPMTAYASQWIQSTAGWKVQSDDGTYLTSQWYQSPESGLFYYLGADGYMMINATTPDGFQVGADGAWIQPTQQSDPVVQPTQSSSDDSMISEEEFDRISEELGIGTPEGDTINSADGFDLDPNGGSYNWHQ